MKYKQIENTFMVYLEQNEDIVETLTQFCKDHEIFNGQISGIGAVKEMKLGAYILETKSYVKKRYDDIRELISFQGNITLLDDEPFIHAHLTLGDHDLNIVGGHIFAGKIAVVGEFIIHKLDSNVKRKLNDDVGLAVWDIKE